VLALPAATRPRLSACTRRGFVVTDELAGALSVLLR